MFVDQRLTTMVKIRLCFQSRYVESLVRRWLVISRLSGYLSGATLRVGTDLIGDYSLTKIKERT